MITKFLSTNWLGMLLAAALALIPLLILNAKLDAARDSLKAQKVINVVMAEKLETQNAAVKAWQDAAKANREVYLAGLDAANRRAIRLEIDAERILQIEPPADPSLRCEAAADILKGVTQ